MHSLMRLVVAVAAVPCLLGGGSAPEADRSPADVALTPDGRWALTANRTSDSVSLVDLEGGTSVAEAPAGKGPFAIATDGKRAIVTNQMSHSITLFRVAPPKLEAVAEITVGAEPRGVAIAGGRAIVALSGENAVVAVDLETGKILGRAPVGREPWNVAATPDGKRLAVACALSAEVRVLETASLKELYDVPLHGENPRQMAVSPDGAWLYVPHTLGRGIPTTTNNIDNGWVISNRLGRISMREAERRKMMMLDSKGKGVADPEAVAVSPDGLRFAVTAGGTHEVTLLRGPLPFIDYGGFVDRIDGRFARNAKRFRRVRLGGRPTGCAFTPDGARVVVANYLKNAIQVIDFETGRVTRTIPVGGPAEPREARRGEEIFYDADRSFGSWYSCHSCHVDGHTGGVRFDTLNDGRYENAKKTPSLRGVTQTGPWTWHGWQKDLRASLRKSLATTMRGPNPRDEDVDALHAFLGTLVHPPPAREGLTDPAARGRHLFRKRGCAECHKRPHYTSEKSHEVGLESKDDAYKGFNPPTLRGVGNRYPWLHDGRAKSLDDVLRVHHRPSKLTGEKDFTDDEVADVIEYLKSL